MYCQTELLKIFGLRMRKTNQYLFLLHQIFIYFFRNPFFISEMTKHILLSIFQVNSHVKERLPIAGCYHFLVTVLEGLHLDINKWPHENEKALTPFYHKKTFDRKWIKIPIWCPTFIFYQNIFYDKMDLKVISATKL